MKDDRLYLIHVGECIARIERYTTGGRDDFMASTLVQDAVPRNLQVLAESTQKLSDAIKAQHPSTDWRKIAGFRNVLVHSYMSIDLPRVWEVAENDLPPLQAEIEAMLQSLP